MDNNRLILSAAEIELVLRCRAESAAHRALQEAIEGHDYAIGVKEYACKEYNRTEAILKKAQVENELAREAVMGMVI